MEFLNKIIQYVKNLFGSGKEIIEATTEAVDVVEKVVKVTGKVKKTAKKAKKLAVKKKEKKKWKLLKNTQIRQPQAIGRATKGIRE